MSLVSSSKAAYLLNDIPSSDGGGSQLTPIALDTGALGKSISLGPVAPDPDGVAISADGTTAYAVDTGDILSPFIPAGSIGSTLVKTDLRTGSHSPPIFVATGPYGVVLDSASGTVYVSVAWGAHIVEVDTASGFVTGIVPVGPSGGSVTPGPVAVTPDGRTAVSTNLSFDLGSAPNDLNITDLVGKRPEAPIALGTPLQDHADSLAMSCTAPTAYVSTAAGIDVVDVATQTFLGVPWPEGQLPYSNYNRLAIARNESVVAESAGALPASTALALYDGAARVGPPVATVPGEIYSMVLAG